MTTDAPSCLVQMPPPCRDRSCHNERKLSVSRGKTHVLHQIGVDIAAEADGMLEISCEQQNLPALDPYDPPYQSWVGAENTSFICTYGQGLGKPTCARTSASTPALVPLLAVLVAALPVPAHENLRASLTAITSFSLSKWVSEMRAASKSDMRM